MGCGKFGPLDGGRGERGNETMSDKFELSRRKMLAGLGTIGVAGAGAGMGTTALYKDTETSKKNTITAGTSDMIVTATLVDASNPGLMEFQNYTGETPSSSSAPDGSPILGFDINDIKPGDYFLVCWDVQIDGNPMYVGAFAEGLSDSENTPNPEPEQNVQDDGTNPDTDNDGIPGEGDLDNQADVWFGYDDPANNNTWDGNTGSASDIRNSFAAYEDGVNGVSLNEFLLELDSGYLYRDGDGPPEGHGSGSATELGNGRSVTHYTLVEVPIDVGNEIMGDSVSWSMRWEAEQVRNNPAPSSASEVDGSANTGGT
jgi:predicted ribosomally synthesized peptide with SipW-like signal peptide